MDRLSEELFLLSINPHRGVVRAPAWIGCSLAGAELARAQSLGLIYYDGEHVRLRAGRAISGSRPADLESGITHAIERARRPVRPSDLVVDRRRSAIEAVSHRLVAQGVVDRRQTRRLGMAGYRYEIIDVRRAAAALEHLRRVGVDPRTTSGSGELAQQEVLFGGLAHLALLARPNLRGPHARPARERLRRLAERHWICVAAAHGIRSLMSG